MQAIVGMTYLDQTRVHCEALLSIPVLSYPFTHCVVISLSFLEDGENCPLTIHDDNLCRICMDATIDCVLLECGHMVTCTKCGKRMNECPICRQYVVRAVHVFKS